MNYSNPTDICPPEVTTPDTEAATCIGPSPVVKFYCDDTTLKQMTKAHEDDAGFDICSAEDILIEPNQQCAVHTGLYTAIPKGYVGLVRPRSGLAFKTCYSIGAGVIDAGYRGEVMVQLRTKDLALHVFKGDRIAQMLVVPVLGEAAPCASQEELGDTARGVNGFGSSGV